MFYLVQISLQVLGLGESQLSCAYVCEECALMHACMHIYICVVEYIF